MTALRSMTIMGEPAKSTVSWTEGIVVTGIVTALLMGLIANATTGNEIPTKAKTQGNAASTGAPITTTLAWPPLPLDAKALASARARYHGDQSKALADDSVKKLHEIVRSLNDHQFVTAPIPTKTRKQLTEELDYALSDVLTLVDPKVGFVPLGKPIFDDCDKGLEQLSSAIKDGSLTLEQAKKDPSFETFPLYRRNCGNMIEEFSTRGLLDDKAQWVDAEAKQLGRILQRYRWASLLRLHTEALKQMPPLEREIFARWRVQSRSAFPIEKRREYLKSLQAYAPDFPQGLAMALLEYDAGRKKQAAEILSRYHNQNPSDPTYATLYKAITEELAGGAKK